MSTVIVYKESGDIVWSQSGNGSLAMVDQAMQRMGIADPVSAILVDEDIHPSTIRQMKVIDGVPVFYETVDQAKEKAFNNLRRTYLSVCDGIDPVTKQRIYVDCTVGETTYRMDAGRKPAETHDGGIRLAEQSGEETTFVVDFNNDVHYAVPIAEAKQIALQQAQDARNHYIEYQTFKQQIAGCSTVEEVRGLNLDFTVNV